METRQPDETRKVGEETAGALTRLLSSPNRTKRSRIREWMWMMFIILTGLTGNGRLFGKYLTQKFGGQPETWLIVGGFAFWGIYSLVSRIILLVSSRNSEYLILRRSASLKLPHSHPAIWSKFFERYIFPSLAFGFTLLCMILCAGASDRTGRFVFSLLALYGAYITALSAPSVIYPLLLVSDNYLQVKRHQIRWAQLDHIQIGSDHEGSTGVMWKFFDSQNKLLAKVWMSDDLREEQKLFVAALAQVLDATIEENPPYIAPRRVEGDSLGFMERPY